MFKYFKKEKKIDNLYNLALSIISIIICVNFIKGNLQIDGTITIMGQNPNLFSIVFIVLSVIIIIFSSLFIIEDQTNKEIINNQYRHLMIKISKIVSLLIIFLLVLDIVVLGVVRSLDAAGSMERYPSGQAFSLQLAYLFVKYVPMILKGIETTLVISLLGTLLGLVIAALLVVFRTQKIDSKDNVFVTFLKKIGLWFTKVYVAIIRGTPMIVQAMIFFYLMRDVFAAFGMSVQEINATWTPFRAGLFTVTINTTAYLIEVLRGGIQSVDKGQIEAGRSLGFSNFKTYLFITFPQALKNSMPSIGNEFIVNIKDTAVLTLIQVVDLFSVTKTIAGNHYAYVPAYLIAAIIYLVLTYTTSKILIRIEKRMDVQAKEITSSN
jgi:putative lysine transport system permease protein